MGSHLGEHESAADERLRVMYNIVTGRPRAGPRPTIGSQALRRSDAIALADPSKLGRGIPGSPCRAGMPAVVGLEGIDQRKPCRAFKGRQTAVPRGQKGRNSRCGSSGNGAIDGTKKGKDRKTLWPYLHSEEGHAPFDLFTHTYNSIQLIF